MWEPPIRRCDGDGGDVAVGAARIVPVVPGERLDVVGVGHDNHEGYHGEDSRAEHDVQQEHGSPPRGDVAQGRQERPDGGGEQEPDDEADDLDYGETGQRARLVVKVARGDVVPLWHA